MLPYLGPMSQVRLDVPIEVKADGKISGINDESAFNSLLLDQWLSTASDHMHIHL